MVNYAKIGALIALIICAVLGVTEYSLHERISSGWPLLVVMYTLVISGCTYMLIWNRRKNKEHALWMKKQQNWSFKDSE